METHDRQKHPEPQGSVMDEPAFIELCRIAKRLPVERRDQLYDVLWTDKRDRITEEFEHAFRMHDYVSLDFETGPLSFTEDCD